MERNNILSAPEIDGVHVFYEIWSRTHPGSRKTFYRFMTTPSVEREEFLASIKRDVVYERGVVEEILREGL